MFVLPLARPSSFVRRAALDRLFDGSFDRLVNDRAADTRTPSMDVSETDTTYSVVLDVPGVTRDQLKVSVEGRRVTLSTVAAGDNSADTQAKTEGDLADANATRAQATKPAQRTLYRERSAAAYARTVVLPSEVDQSASQAKFDNGVLTLTLAKKVPAGATQLSIA